MSKVCVIVPREWSDEMRSVALKFAKETSRDDYALLVGFAFLLWPLLLDAGRNDSIAQELEQRCFPEQLEAYPPDLGDGQDPL